MLDLHVESAGEGTPLLLLHAGVADARMWDPVWNELAAARHVIRYDARGFGRSPDPTGAWSAPGDAFAVLDAAGVERAHLVGASMGGYRALECALVAPERVASVVVAAGAAGVVEPPAELIAEWERVDALVADGRLDEANELELRLWVDGTRDPVPDHAAAVRALVGPSNRALLERQQSFPDPEELEPPLPERLGEITAPVLIVSGEADVANAIAWCERLAAELPEAQLVRWPDVAHMVTLERPREFARLVLDFTS